MLTECDLHHDRRLARKSHLQRRHNALHAADVMDKKLGQMSSRLRKIIENKRVFPACTRPATAPTHSGRPRVELCQDGRSGHSQICAQMKRVEHATQWWDEIQTPALGVEAVVFKSYEPTEDEPVICEANVRPPVMPTTPMVACCGRNRSKPAIDDIYQREELASRMCEPLVLVPPVRPAATQAVKCNHSAGKIEKPMQKRQLTIEPECRAAFPLPSDANTARPASSSRPASARPASSSRPASGRPTSSSTRPGSARPGSACMRNPATRPRTAAMSPACASPTPTPSTPNRNFIISGMGQRFPQRTSSPKRVSPCESRSSSVDAPLSPTASECARASRRWEQYRGRHSNSLASARLEIPNRERKKLCKRMRERTKRDAFLFATTLDDAITLLRNPKHARPCSSRRMQELVQSTQWQNMNKNPSAVDMDAISICEAGRPSRLYRARLTPRTLRVAVEKNEACE